LRSRRSAGAWLLEKEWRELLASRAWWLFLALIGPLVGISFIDAVRTYAEASGLNGTAAGVGEAFSPLIGILGPTFSACEIAAAFLLPFVAIRLVAGDKQSGALKLEAQHRMSSFQRLLAKVVVLLAGWIIASAAPLIAVALWAWYGGTLHPPEIASVLTGHLLNAGLVVALAAAAACATEHPSTAAILTLAVTVGTWILNFAAAVHGGLWETAAGYTPTAMVADFQHGLVRLDVLMMAATFIVALLACASAWMRPGAAIRRRVRDTALVAAVASLAVFLSAVPRVSWDVSEDRANSFSRSDEEALRRIQAPLRIEAHLAPEDPRRFDLEHRALSKLRRVLPDVEVEYVSATSIGLFEQSNPHYGEITFQLDGRSAVSRATTAEGVLDTIYELANVSPPAAVEDEDIFRGHPLAAPPKGAALIFYGVWPAAVAGAALIWRKQS
jgi:ABC-2 type transport system permease protein